MLLGIPRGFFYYDYISFVRKLFEDTDVNIIEGQENDESILSVGSRLTVDEACFPIKLFVGQVQRLIERCDKVLVPRVMKDCNGRWLCPKLLGLPELSSRVSLEEKLIVTEPVYFDNKNGTRKALWHACRGLKVKKQTFEKNFEYAYNKQLRAAAGMENVHVEAGWEFMPKIPKQGEIILPNIRKVLVLGHCYNVYDKFANCGIMEKLDELAIGTVTEACVSQVKKEEAVSRLRLAKKPFWEAFVRIIGAAKELEGEIDGIIYLSSFSCGPDAFISEMLKKYVKETPVMILKLDEHRGEAGLETRLEAFADLLKRRRPA